METTHTHHAVDLKGFYTFIGLIAFGIVVLQPFAMLAVMFLNAIAQNQ